MADKCVWLPDFDGSVWNTDCGQAFCFEVGTPTENLYRFCPYCGKELSEFEPEEEKYDCPIHGLQDGPDCPRC